MLTNTGTCDYKAPEVIAGAVYDQTVDMWSIGVMLYYCLSGQKPFRAKYLDKLNKKILEAKLKWNEDIWTSISNEAKIFLKACLTKISFVRIIPKEALYHPWIKEIKLSNDNVGDINSNNNYANSPNPLQKQGSHKKTQINVDARRKTAPIHELQDFVKNKLGKRIN